MKKRPHVFTWDDEPRAERPSAFAPSTCAPTESWFDSLPESRKKSLRRSPTKGLVTLVLLFVVVLALSGCVMYEVAKLLNA